LIWQTGKPYAEQGKTLANGLDGVWVSDFIKEMEYAYAAADVVISRAGAMAIAELSVLGKPAILVPYPFAAEDHQTVNALKLEKKQAGILVRDDEARGKLVDEAVGLVKNENKRNELSRNIGILGIKDADMVIAGKILGK
jgi:UDP-N-acetylglucosamine--N-acetylmuramyl-(pentapeptide) pyrophosphoryl-undecaprenol N-acetylglucosamine transferase